MLISNLAINFPVNTQVVYIVIVLPEGINFLLEMIAPYTAQFTYISSIIFCYNISDNFPGIVCAKSFHHFVLNSKINIKNSYFSSSIFQCLRLHRFASPKHIINVFFASPFLSLLITIFYIYYDFLSQKICLSVSRRQQSRWTWMHRVNGFDIYNSNH